MAKPQSRLAAIFVNRDDYRLRLADFNPLIGINVVRVICGAFMFPHAASAFADGGFAPGTVAFVTAAGFGLAQLWILLTVIAEVLSGIALILGFCTRFAALLAMGVLIASAYALYQAKGGVWLADQGGYEFPVFWGICCLAVAIEAWIAWFRRPRRIVATEPDASLTAPIR